MPDNEMKAGIFPGKVIIVAGGKLFFIQPPGFPPMPVLLPKVIEV
jgi:hypothetical protein